MKELTEINTSLLRFGLGVEESRSYWVMATPGEQASALTAFEQSWFGQKTQARVKLILGYLKKRYDAYPIALAALHQWNDLDLSSARLVCHWHTQLAVPFYRTFTSWLASQRAAGFTTVTRDELLRWVELEQPGRWASATKVAWANKLLSAAYEAGLVSKRSAKGQSLELPPVPASSLAYALYLLKDLTFQGTILNNPYFASVGLSEPILMDRARSIGVSINKQGDLIELNFEHPNFQAWLSK